MPKIGMEPQRREALIKAAIAQISADGLVDVTVGGIARRAGVSPALAHHYFGSKDEILVAALRRILADHGRAVRRKTAAAQSPRARLDAIVIGSFGKQQFNRKTINACMAFYASPQRNLAVQRLLNVYARRLQSNLVHDLARLVPKPAARRIAARLGALIDGVYMRAALQDGAADRQGAIAMVADDLDLMLAKETARCASPTR